MESPDPPWPPELLDPRRSGGLKDLEPGQVASRAVMSDFVSLCLVFPCPYLVFLSSLVH